MTRAFGVPRLQGPGHTAHDRCNLPDFHPFEMLAQRSELEETDIVVYLVRVSDEVRELFEDSGFLECVGEKLLRDSIVPSVDSFGHSGLLWVGPPVSTKHRDRANSFAQSKNRFSAAALLEEFLRASPVSKIYPSFSPW